MVTTSNNIDRSLIQRVPFVQVDHALVSSRDSGFDLATAGGEVIDNAYQANASIVRIKPVSTPKGIEAIAFADDGVGIPANILAHVLSLGFSTRYGQRNGLGRFGVGLKLASLSQARRIDIYTRPVNENIVYRTYIDLDEIQDGTQQYLEATAVPTFPREFVELMSNPDGTPFDSGTLVVWTKTDRLMEHKKYRESNAERLNDFLKFIARAYRRFIDNGFRIEFDGKLVSLHDPTFQLENPRVTEKLADLRGEVVFEDVIDIDDDGKNDIRVLVSLAPEVFREKRGAGGKSFADLSQIDADTAGRISLLRQGREIYYEIIPKLFPTRIEDIDRFIGIEVSFPATLDEYFQVRNVKRGAEPVDKLRRRLRETLDQPIRTARKRIRALHKETVTKERAASGEEHAINVTTVSRVDSTLPQGRGGFDLSEPDVERRLKEVLKATGVEPTQDNIKQFRERLDVDPIQVRDAEWPSKELLDIDHINGRVIIRVNHNHPIIANVYDQIRSAVQGKSNGEFSPEAMDLLRKAEAAFDALIIGYAKAESMHRKPDEQYGDLRNQWGHFSASFMNEALKSV